MSADESLDLAHGPAWANRLALAPLTNQQSHADGTLSDDERRWLVARAEGGFGLVMTCATYVDRAGQAWPGQLGISDDAQLPGLSRLAEELRAAGTVSSVQLHHAGQRADSAVSGVPTVAPWSDEAKGVQALDTGQVHAAVEAFVSAAARAERAGFDGVQVHGAHGYLVGQFMDVRRNHREDAYGGSPENRSRFLLEVLEGIRGEHRPRLPGRAAPVPRALRHRPRRGHRPDRARCWPAVCSTTSTSPCGTSAPRPTAPRTATGCCSSTSGPAAPGCAWARGQGADRRGRRLVPGAGADFATVGTGAIIHHDFARRALAEPGFRQHP